ncbi:Uncharacterised protein [[Flavobacterium] thermophilum]|nr:Uncharacterised protein [[Flavobacterium] thermophilum]
MNRLAHHQGIHKFFVALGLALYFSKPVIKHLVHIVDALTTKGFSGTLTDIHHWSFHPNHRTTLSHFSRKALGMKRRCFANSSNGSFIASSESPNGRLNPFLFRLMIPFAKKRSLRHGLHTPFKGVIGISLTKIINLSGGIRSFG